MAPNTPYLFDIPIYWVMQAKYEADQTAFVRKSLYENFDAMGVVPESCPETYLKMRLHMPDVFGGPWQFTQIVGYLRIFVAERAIGGEPWMVNAKRMGRRMKKVFYRKSTNVLLAHNLDDCHSGEILRRILTRIEELPKEAPFKRKHFDLSTFKRLAPFVEWNALVKSSCDE